MKYWSQKTTVKHLARDWFVYTLGTFFMCDILWELIDYGEWEGTWSDALADYLVDLTYCGVFSLASILTTIFVTKLRYFKKVTYMRLISLGLITLAVNLLIAILCENVYYYFWPTDDDSFWGSIYFFCFISSLASMAHTSQHYSMMIIKQNEEKIALQKKILKLQLDPHIVFNSLSILAGLTRIDPEKAEEFTIRMSRIYRRIMADVDHDTVSVEDSLKFAKDDVALLNIRFADKIVLDTSRCEAQENEGILTLAMQVVIENAAKHSMPQRDEKLIISISREDDYLVVGNNRPIEGCANAPETSTGIGLTNLRKRYLLECGKDIRISMTEKRFEVSLPIVRMKESDNRGE